MRDLLLFIFYLLSLTPSLAQRQKVADVIHLNQVGFYPSASKIAVVETTDAQSFEVINSSNKSVFQGKLVETKNPTVRGTRTKIADFSAVNQPGSYTLVVPGVGSSHTFEVNTNVLSSASKAALKGFYYQRCSIRLDEKFAGKWKRPAGHPDDVVLIHESAVSAKRPAGFVISSSRGWLDAGDYNKYVVNSGITTATMLSAFEDFPEYYRDLDLNIPESSNAVPDILDEVLWNLRWMLTMQDPNDGGVYHKCTNAKFDSMIMPHEATAPRYVIQKSTSAALNFVALTAQASRVFKAFESHFPGLSDSCRTASERAWSWAIEHPDIVYNQELLNNKYDPDITTGAYGDKSLSDELFWASCELFLLTNDSSYHPKQDEIENLSMNIPSWNSVAMLGVYSLLRNTSSHSELLSRFQKTLKTKLLQFSESLVEEADNSAYQCVMGLSKGDFIWGSNAVAANQGILLIQAFRLSNDPKFLHFALSNVDYLFGRNATNYSFITGYGEKTPMHIHHRPSEADKIDEPVPGLLAGGPNPGMQDKCSYPSAEPDKAYVDDVCSYASNEIAINWNAPLVYLLGAVEAHHQNK